MNPSEAIKYKYSILGAGRSGLGIAKLLSGKGAYVFLSDSSSDSNLTYLNKYELNKYKFEFEFEKHSDKVFDCDILIKSPGIPPESEIIKKFKKKNIKIVSEVEAASWFCQSPIIAITGTNGKTTTTVLTGEIFKNAGFDVKVCGNIGFAFSEVINSLNPDSVVILEVSSFQLFDTADFKPNAGIILNLTPDHIDWHGSIENYFNSKLNINRNQKEKDYFIFNYDDDYLRNHLFEKELSGKVSTFGYDNSTDESGKITRKCFVDNGNIIYSDFKNNISSEIIEVHNIRIKGKHNVYNSMSAVLAAKCFNIQDSVIAKTLSEFKGVEHRIESVREKNGVEFFNDSKATNFDSTYVALESFPGNIILIMGGKKGSNNFNLIEKHVRDRVKRIIAIGQIKNEIYNYFSEIVAVSICDTLEDEVIESFRGAKKGDKVLFSPAYKSFDMFDNFEHRGKEFKKYVNKL